jgi:putative protease
LSISVLESIGFSGVIVSPELGREDIFKLCRSSPLPMGIVISGNWPLCISRTISQGFKTQELFVSPMGEHAWVARHGDDFWVYPNWKLDLTAKRDELIKAGCKLFVHMEETLPGKVSMKKRPGLWNWKLKLL